jgi:hypothetical protein
VITDDVQLNRNLRKCADGLVVTGASVTIDLKGYTISGTGSTGTGVRAEADSEVTITNGTIREFGVGVSIGAADVFIRPHFHFRSLKIVRNGIGVFVASDDPIDPDHPSTIEASELERNVDAGIRADHHRGLEVTDSSIRGNGSDGISVRETPLVLLRSDVSNNGGNGLVAVERPVTLSDNTFNGNGTSGAHMHNHASDALSWSRLQNNQANRNGALGFFVNAYGNGLPWEGFDAGGNVARNNGDDRQCVVDSFSINGFPLVPPEALTCSKRAGR